MRLIDSDALDDKLEALVQKYTAQGRPEVAKDYSFVQTVLLTAPTVDAGEEVHARWIERPLDNFRKYEVKCSECGFIGIGNYDQYLEPAGFNYCPNCGAKMDGGNEDVQISC